MANVSHGLVFLVCAFVSIPLLPWVGNVWPLPFAVPLGLYFVIVLSSSKLRRSLAWATLGGRRPQAWCLAAVVALATTLILVGFQHWRSPDLAYLHELLPIGALGWAPIAILFPVGNAVLEEVVFRGILHAAFVERWGVARAIAGTSLLFGLCHLSGYPPGPIGALFAGIYGVALGILRVYSDGLLVPTVIHVCADATILGILWWHKP